MPLVRFQFAILFALIATVSCRTMSAAEKFTAPESARQEYGFDADWKFFKEDQSKIDGAAAPGV